MILVLLVGQRGLRLVPCLVAWATPVSATPTLVRPASKLVAPVGAVGVAVRAVRTLRTF